MEGLAQRVGIMVVYSLAAPRVIAGLQVFSEICLNKLFGDLLGECLLTPFAILPLLAEINARKNWMYGHYI